MERIMKAQELILKAAAGKFNCWEAAEIMGVTGPYDGALERSPEGARFKRALELPKRSRSPKRVPRETVEKVLQLYREHYRPGSSALQDEFCLRLALVRAAGRGIRND